MIYLSSNTERRKKIKNICKKYSDLPSYIVKQIIDYKLDKSNKFDLRKEIKNVWNIDQEISKTESAVNDAIKTVEVINNPYIHELLVYIDCGGEYSIRTTVKLAIDRISYLRKKRRQIIQTARYEHVVRPFVKSKENKIMGVTEEQKKELYFANVVIGAIDNAETPMLMYEGEKNVVKKALQIYIDKLESE